MQEQLKDAGAEATSTEKVVADITELKKLVDAEAIYRGLPFPLDPRLEERPSDTVGTVGHRSLCQRKRESADPHLGDSAD